MHLGADRRPLGYRAASVILLAQGPGIKGPGSGSTNPALLPCRPSIWWAQHSTSSTSHKVKAAPSARATFTTGLPETEA